jgi:hypothetical protein
MLGAGPLAAFFAERFPLVWALAKLTNPRAANRMAAAARRLFGMWSFILWSNRVLLQGFLR